jgi:hypothetical protein
VTDLKNIITVPSVDQITINVNLPYTLNVRLSKDPNNLPGNFEYHWQCMKDHVKCVKQFPSTDQPDFTIKPGDLELGVYTFNVNVTKAFFTDSAQMTVNVSSASTPQIYLERTMANYLHNIEEDLYIKAYVSDAETVQVEWFAESETLEDFVNLQELSYYNIIGPTNWTANSPQYQEFPLILPKPNKSLHWNGLKSDTTYVLSLKVFSPNSNRGSKCTLFVHTNSGPSINSFKVSKSVQKYQF